VFQDIDVSKNQSRNVKTCYKKFSGLEVNTMQGFGLIGWTICMLKNIGRIVLRNLEDELFYLILQVGFYYFGTKWFKYQDPIQIQNYLSLAFLEQKMELES
jgi:hypothetical protein